MKRFFGLVLFVSLFQFLSSPSEAYKEVSGGNGVGGTLRDRFSHGEVEKLDGYESYLFVSKIYSTTLSKFPLLKDAAYELYAGRNRKALYLDDRELNPACLNSSTVSGSAVIWACQNDVEIRINKLWWNSASESARADLLLHELLTAIDFKSDLRGAVEPAFAALSDQTLSATQIVDEFNRLKFAKLYETREVSAVEESLIQFSTRVCSSKTLTDRDLLIFDAVAELSKATGKSASYLFVQAAEEHLKEMTWQLPDCASISRTHAHQLIWQSWNPF